MKITDQSKEMFREASEELNLIIQTWQNSEPDSVSFVVCHSVKECMEKLLKCYFLMQTGKMSKTRSLTTLLAQCADFDERLKKVDPRWVVCKDHNFKTSVGVFCDSHQQIEVCMLIANGIRNFIGDEIKSELVPAPLIYINGSFSPVK
jgi:hypothetical protein